VCGVHVRHDCRSRVKRHTKGGTRVEHKREPVTLLDGDNEASCTGQDDKHRRSGLFSDSGRLLTKK
jgi:hypothetical protein